MVKWRLCKYLCCRGQTNIGQEEGRRSQEEGITTILWECDLQVSLPYCEISLQCPTMRRCCTNTAMLYMLIRTLLLLQRTMGPRTQPGIVLDDHFLNLILKGGVQSVEDANLAKTSSCTLEKMPLLSLDFKKRLASSTTSILGCTIIC